MLMKKNELNTSFQDVAQNDSAAGIVGNRKNGRSRQPNPRVTLPHIGYRQGSMKT
jgi:hypothetical protein